MTVTIEIPKPTNGRSLEQALDECRREQGVRHRCFPGWVKDGRLSRSDAKDRLERMDAAVQFLAVMLAAVEAAGPKIEDDDVPVVPGQDE